MLVSTAKFVALAAAIVAYVVYVLSHPKYSDDYLRESFVSVRTVLWGIIVVVGLVLTLTLRSWGSVPAGVLAMLMGYVNFRYLVTSLSADVSQRPVLFFESRMVSAWFGFCVIVVLLGLASLLLHRPVLAAIAAVGLVVLHFATPTITGLRAANRETLLVQVIVQSYVAARRHSDSAPERDVLAMTLDIASGRLRKHAQARDYETIERGLAGLKQEVATGDILDITKLAESSLAAIYPLDGSDHGAGDGLKRQWAEHERRAKLVSAWLDAAAVPAHLRGRSAQLPTP